MKKKINQTQIINALVASEAPEGFKISLETKLKYKLFKKSFNMKKLLITSISILSVAALSTVAYLNYTTSQFTDYDKVEVALNQSDNNSDASLGLKLAVDDRSSLSEAQESLKFTLLKPAKIFEGKLAQVQTSKTFDESKSDALFVTFAKDGKSYFKLYEVVTAQENFSVSEESEKVSLKIQNQNITGYITTYEVTDIDPNSEMAIYEGSYDQPTTALSFYINGIMVDISEFGSLSKSELIEIAQSM